MVAEARGPGGWVGLAVRSGGAGALSHLRVLAAAGLHSLAGAIAGTALYEGKFTVREGQAVLEGPS